MSPNNGIFGDSAEFVFIFSLYFAFLLQHTEHLAQEASKGSLQRRIMDTFGGYVALIPSISQHLPF